MLKKSDEITRTLPNETEKRLFVRECFGHTILNFITTCCLNWIVQRWPSFPLDNCRFGHLNWSVRARLHRTRF